ncbi:MAG: permease, partial [Rubripirellula sp.]
VYPILVFVGLEITAQSFLATPRKHYAAVALACLPALAFLALSFPNQMFGDAALRDAGIQLSTLQNSLLQTNLKTIGMLSSGFIITSLLWAWTLAKIVDREIKVAALVMALAGVLTAFGVIHSPLPGNQLFVLFGPESWGNIVLDDANRGAVIEYVAGYFASAILLVAWSMHPNARSPVTNDDDAIAAHE